MPGDAFDTVVWRKSGGNHVRSLSESCAIRLPDDLLLLPADVTTTQAWVLLFLSIFLPWLSSFTSVFADRHVQAWEL